MNKKIKNNLSFKEKLIKQIDLLKSDKNFDEDILLELLLKYINKMIPYVKSELGFEFDDDIVDNFTIEILEKFYYNNYGILRKLKKSENVFQYIRVMIKNKFLSYYNLNKNTNKYDLSINIIGNKSDDLYNNTKKENYNNLVELSSNDVNVEQYAILKENIDILFKFYNNYIYNSRNFKKINSDSNIEEKEFKNLNNKNRNQSENLNNINKKLLHVKLHILRKFLKYDTKKLAKIFSLSESNINTIISRLNERFVRYLTRSDLYSKELEDVVKSIEFKNFLIDYIEELDKNLENK